MYTSLCKELQPSNSIVTEYGFHYQHPYFQTEYVAQAFSRNKKDALDMLISCVRGVKTCSPNRC